MSLLCFQVHIDNTKRGTLTLFSAPAGWTSFSFMKRKCSPCLAGVQPLVWPSECQAVSCLWGGPWLPPPSQHLKTEKLVTVPPSWLILGCAKSPYRLENTLRYLFQCRRWWHGLYRVPQHLESSWRCRFHLCWRGSAYSRWVCGKWFIIKLDLCKDFFFFSLY